MEKNGSAASFFQAPQVSAQCNQNNRMALLLRSAKQPEGCDDGTLLLRLSQGLRFARIGSGVHQGELPVFSHSSGLGWGRGGVANSGGGFFDS